MAKFAVICIFVIVACLGLSYAAPLDNHDNNRALKQDLAKKFVEFIQQDEQLSSLLSENSHSDLVRIRRADDVESVDETNLNTNTEGFFDRAARFVMEVLQRFLRWVNTDD